jgi:hypothetical protein
VIILNPCCYWMWNVTAFLVVLPSLIMNMLSEISRLCTSAIVQHTLDILQQYRQAHSDRNIRASVVKVKVFLLQVWCGSWGSRSLRLLNRLHIRYYEGGKVVILTHRPPSPPGVFLVLIFRGWIDPRAHGFVGSLGKNPQRHHRGSIPRPSD